MVRGEERVARFPSRSMRLSYVRQKKEGDRLCLSNDVSKRQADSCLEANARGALRCAYIWRGDRGVIG